MYNSQRLAHAKLRTLGRFASSYFGITSILLFAVLTPLGFMSGGFEKYAWAVDWLFNLPAAIGIPSAVVAYKLIMWKRSHPSSSAVKRSHRLSNLISLGILMAVMEILGYTFGFVESVMVTDNLDSLFPKIPDSIIAFYALIYIGIPLASSFYDLQLGDRHTLLGLIYDGIKQRLPLGARRIAQRFYRVVQVSV